MQWMTKWKFMFFVLSEINRCPLYMHLQNQEICLFWCVIKRPLPITGDNCVEIKMASNTGRKIISLRIYTWKVYGNIGFRKDTTCLLKTLITKWEVYLSWTKRLSSALERFAHGPDGRSVFFKNPEHLGMYAQNKLDQLELKSKTWSKWMVHKTN